MGLIIQINDFNLDKNQTSECVIHLLDMREVVLKFWPFSHQLLVIYFCGKYQTRECVRRNEKLKLSRSWSSECQNI